MEYMTIEREVELEQTVADPKQKIQTPEVIAIGGGKGGVGKSVISASIGMGLAMLGRDVVVIDLDLGGSNLHSIMGIDNPLKTLYDFIYGQEDNLQSLLIENTEFKNLKVICGATGSVGMANLGYARKKKLIKHIKQIQSDYVILDLGAGSSYNTLDLFLSADQPIVLNSPDPLAILDSYNFIKQAFFRKLSRVFRKFNGVDDLVRIYSIMETHRKSPTLEELTMMLEEVDNAAVEQLKEIVREFHPLLLVNMVEHQKEEAEALAVKTAAQELLSIEIYHIGSVAKDEVVKQSIDAMIPFIGYDSKCRASRDLADILILKVLQYSKFKAMYEKQLIKGRLKKNLKQSREAVICSIRCFYWDECIYKKGGYPCKLQHLSGIRGFHGD